MQGADHPIGPTVTPSAWSPLDRALLWLISGLGAIGALFLLLIPGFLLPAEDAVILFQFSRNLALTGAVTYLPNGPHAEGATDFAWMVLLALGIRVGIPPFWFVAIINFVCIFVLAFLLLRIAGARIRPLPMLFVMGCFTLMPQMFAAAVGFSTLPFSCLLALLTLCFLRRSDVAMPLVALLLCLFRPDGVVFAIPLMIAALIIYPDKTRRLALHVGLFVLPGVAYFLTRWHYYHNMLPLPFLVKSNAERIAHVLVAGSLREGKLLLLFVLVVLSFVLRGRLGDAKNRAVLLCMVVLPNCFYLAMRLDQDIGLRFFIYLPLGVGLLLAMNWNALQARRGFYLHLALGAWLLFVFHDSFSYGHSEWAQQFDTRTAIAKEMGALPRGTILLTEAGIVPYYSHWTAYDAWGLNTEQFARHLIQPADVGAINPDALLLVSFQEPACTPHSDWRTPYTERNWNHMTRNLLAGADPAQYELWFVPFGNAVSRARKGVQPAQGEHECWLLRRSSPEEPAMAQILARHGGLSREQMAQANPGALVDQESADGATGIAPKPGSRGGTLSRLWHLLD